MQAIPDTPHGMQKHGLVGFGAFATLFWTLAILASVEVLLEARGASRGFETLLFRPAHLAGAHASEKADLVYGPIAGFPFRSRVLSGPPVAGGERIWIASASHAEDLYVRADQVFPNRLAAALGMLGVSADVVNGSRAGMTISDNVELLQEHADRLEPTVVVLYQMSIDITRMSKLRERPRPDNDSQRPTSQPLPWNTRLRAVSEKTTTYSMLKSNVTPRLTRAKPLVDRLPEWCSEVYEEQVKAFVSEVRSLGATPVLCTFALSHREPEDIIDEHFLGILRFNPNLSRRAWTSTVFNWNDRIRQIGAELGVTVCDLDRTLDRGEGLFRDLVHFTPEGHRRVADEIAAAVAKPIAARGGTGRL